LSRIFSSHFSSQKRRDFSVEDKIYDESNKPRDVISYDDDDDDDDDDNDDEKLMLVFDFNLRFVFTVKNNVLIFIFCF
jgi:hypothetical protein